MYQSTSRKWVNSKAGNFSNVTDKDKINEDYPDWIFSLSPKSYAGIPCYYDQFRDQDGNFTMTHWKMLAMKLGFVIVYEHLVLTFTKSIDFFWSDVPDDLRIKIQRQQYLSQQLVSFNDIGIPEEEVV